MSAATAIHRFRNRLLAALPEDDIALLEPQLAPVLLQPRSSLELPQRKPDALYFIEDGVASIAAVADAATRVEVALVGPEGFVGVGALFGHCRTLRSTFMPVMVRGHRIEAAAMRAAMKHSQPLRDILWRYGQTIFVQAAFTAIANAKASIAQRLARWLLMMHDRIQGKELSVTHEVLAVMLGTRRPGVTSALNMLSRRGLVRTKRGLIVVTDRGGLEAHAGRFYGPPEAEYARIMG